MVSTVARNTASQGIVGFNGIKGGLWPSFLFCPFSIFLGLGTMYAKLPGELLEISFHEIIDSCRPSHQNDWV